MNHRMEDAEDAGDAAESALVSYCPAQQMPYFWDGRGICMIGVRAQGMQPSRKRSRDAVSAEAQDFEIRHARVVKHCHTV